MAADHTPDAEVSPADELASAEAALAVLRGVLTGLGSSDLTKQTPCSEFDVAALSDHLLRSITLIGEAAGAAIPMRDNTASLEEQISAAARPALDVWHSRGLGGSIPFGPNEVPATMMAGILSLEFLVHAWDYATATGRRVEVPDTVAEYVFAIAKRTISPDARTQVGFDDAIDVADNASPFERLIAFTGRTPA